MHTPLSHTSLPKNKNLQDSRPLSWPGKGEASFNHTEVSQSGHDLSNEVPTTHMGALDYIPDSQRQPNSHLLGIQVVKQQMIALYLFNSAS